MSEIAAWANTNTATVKPFQGKNGMTGKVIYGEPYEIACTWIADGKVYRDSAGKEFVSNYTIFTEDARPQTLDQVLIDSPGALWQEILQRLEWDMSMFDMAPDYKLVT